MAEKYEDYVIHESLLPPSLIATRDKFHGKILGRFSGHSPELNQLMCAFGLQVTRGMRKQEKIILIYEQLELAELRIREEKIRNEVQVMLARVRQPAPENPPPPQD